MIDFHNHIVPRVDDGAKSMEHALEMLQTALEQGVTEIIATPHRQHPNFESLKVTDEMIIQSYNNLVAKVKEKNIPIKIHLAAEIYFQQNLVSLVNHPFACFGDYRFILVEFSTSYLPASYKKLFNELLNLGVTPIVAHPERYAPIYEDFSILKKLYAMGALIQLDAGSLLGTLGDRSQKLAKKILSKGYAHFIGSDAHNTSKRNFCIGPAYELAYKMVGPDAEILVEHNPYALIYGEEIFSFQQSNTSWLKKISNYIINN